MTDRHTQAEQQHEVAKRTWHNACACLRTINNLPCSQASKDAVGRYQQLAWRTLLQCAGRLAEERRMVAALLAQVPGTAYGKRE